MAFIGFTPFREMVDSKDLLPGAVIVVGRAANKDAYIVLSPENRGENPEYGLELNVGPRGWADRDVVHNARDVLKGMPWYVKE